ncbi:MAG: riboflavin synthase [Phycisphaerales bacterium]|jgi:riboflavin synthase
MFTGLIQAIGTVKSAQPSPAGARLVIDPAGWSHFPSPGDSIAVSGCCLTVVNSDGNSSGENGGSHGGLTFDVIPESLAKTMLGTLEPGSRVNLEHAVTASTLMGGHTVQGHVDVTGGVLSVSTDSEYRVRLGVPPSLMKFMIPKGCVTIDGISLTLAAISPAESWIEVTLIPETLERTTLGEKAAGDKVNLEADIMVKTIVHTMEQVRLTQDEASE